MTIGRMLYKPPERLTYTWRVAFNVMAGLGPAIHDFVSPAQEEDVDGRPPASAAMTACGPRLVESQSFRRLVLIHRTKHRGPPRPSARPSWRST
jgi:hypothetical protein